ncbi:IclR family transcriptional regulator domain-containing protein, partial [Escherichia coli]|uniref:IclR family transcriptional regulator domain-containing protein n=1 Tax=Escherichia coli TaxID=562 RepID=UPI0025A5E161
MVDTEDKLARLKQPLRAFTANTITTLAALRADIEKATASGVALAFDEFAEGVSGIAAPVVGVDRKVHAM